MLAQSKIQNQLFTINKNYIYLNCCFQLRSVKAEFLMATGSENKNVPPPLRAYSTYL